MSEDGAKTGGLAGLIDFRKPLDINTIVVLVTMVGGGFMFMANTNAKITIQSEQIRELKLELAYLNSRIDHLFEEQRAAK